MKPSRKPPSGTDDLFRSRLENIIDMGHLLVRLGAAIDWAFFDDAYDAFYSEEGRPGIPTRMMVGVHILKHMFDLSDVNGGAKLVHPGGAKLVHLTLCGTRCWGVVPAVHRRDPRCFV